MKKIKAMLAGIAILAVVGGVFAFKAKGAYGTNIFYTTAVATYIATPSFEAKTATYTTVATTVVHTTSVYYTTGGSSVTTSCFPTKAYLTTKL